MESKPSGTSYLTQTYHRIGKLYGFSNQILKQNRDAKKTYFFNCLF